MKGRAWMPQILLACALGVALAVGGPGELASEDASAHRKTYRLSGMCFRDGWNRTCEYRWRTYHHHNGRPRHWVSEYRSFCKSRYDGSRRRWEGRGCSKPYRYAHYRT